MVSATKPPALRCGGCGNILGQRFPGYLSIHHRGREIDAVQVLSIRCEECGQRNYPERCPESESEASKC